MTSSGIECGICLAEIVVNSDYYIITEEEGNQACLSCVVEFILPLFPLALKEINFPPTWRHEIALHPSEFKPEVDAAYGPEFIALYEKVTLEYATLPALRVYCKHLVDPHDEIDGKVPDQGKTSAIARWKDPDELPWSYSDRYKKERLRPCGAFVAAKPKPEPDPEPVSSPTLESKGIFPRLAKLFSGYARVEAVAPVPKTETTPSQPVTAATCDSCLGRCFACCGEPIIDVNETYDWDFVIRQVDVLTIPHVCEPSAEARERIDLGVRGVDYQICPKEHCSRPIQLLDGCNHVLCLCGEGYCFICGQGGLKDEDDHWVEKRDGIGCPKWNKKNALNAYYDRA